MATKSCPENATARHGNPTCARYGCKRAECLEASRAYKRENEANRRNGVRATVSVDRAVKHMKALLDSGMPTPDMESISGIHGKTLTKILNGHRERIHWITEEAILGIPIPEGDWESPADCYVDAWPAERRLKALGVQGFTTPLLARELGIDRTAINAVRSGKRHKIYMSTMKAIKQVHDRLYDADPIDFGVSPGDLTRARKWAEREGWYPTEAWANIDDPDCKPSLGAPKYVILAENARELMEGQGYTRQQAAERLGVTYDTLKAAILHYNKVKANA